MDLSTLYLGCELPHPFMPGASVMSEDLDMVRRLEDAGAAAIVLHSLFEEQIVAEATEAHAATEVPANSFAEALTYFPTPEQFRLGPDDYLDHVRAVKDAVGVPVIGSLNGVSRGGWLDYAQSIENAGADALELNIYFVATDPDETAGAVEARFVEMVGAVKQAVSIPVAVKLSRAYTAMPNLVKAMANAGADGIVLFNRFYQPDIDIDELEVERTLQLSDSAELLPRLSALASVSGRVDISLAVTGGVHTAEDAIKAIMCGADAVQMVSALLRNGPGHLNTVREQVAHWLEDHEYESLEQMRGSMSLDRCPDPKAFERGNYMQVLKSYRL